MAWIPWSAWLEFHEFVAHFNRAAPLAAMAAESRLDNPGFARRDAARVRRDGDVRRRSRNRVLSADI
jgi:hypothetical protein